MDPKVKNLRVKEKRSEAAEWDRRDEKDRRRKGGLGSGAQNEWAGEMYGQVSWEELTVKPGCVLPCPPGRTSCHLLFISSVLSRVPPLVTHAFHVSPVFEAIKEISPQPTNS